MENNFWKVEDCLLKVLCCCRGFEDEEERAPLLHGGTTVHQTAATSNTSDHHFNGVKPRNTKQSDFFFQNQPDIFYEGDDEFDHEVPVSNACIDGQHKNTASPTSPRTERARQIHGASFKSKEGDTNGVIYLGDLVRNSGLGK